MSKLQFVFALILSLAVFFLGGCAHVGYTSSDGSLTAGGRGDLKELPQVMEAASRYQAGQAIEKVCIEAIADFKAGLSELVSCEIGGQRICLSRTDPYACSAYGGGGYFGYDRCQTATCRASARGAEKMEMRRQLLSAQRSLEGQIFLNDAQADVNSEQQRDIDALLKLLAER